MTTADIQTIQKQAATLDAKLRRRNLLETTVGLGLIAWFGLGGLWSLGAQGDLALGLSKLLLAGGVGLVVRTLAQRGRAPRAELTDGLAAFLANYRAELAWQAKLLREVPRWYLGPLVPGLLALFAATAWERVQTAGGVMWAEILPMALSGLVVPGLVFAGIAWLNRMGARELEQRLERVPTLDS